MADKTQNVAVSRIDAPFPEAWREGLFEFTKEIAAIKELLGVMALSQTESKEAQKALTELYTKESVAERASQAILAEQPRARVLDQYGAPIGASQAYTPAGMPTPPTQRTPFYSPEPPPGSPYYQPPSENPSRPPDQEQNILDREISMPQHYGGKYTAQDMLILAGKLARKGGAEGVAGGLGGLAGTAPNVEAGYNLIKTYANSARQMSQGLQSYSTSLGYQPGAGPSVFGGNNLDLGPLGVFRNPLSSGALSGLGSMVGSFGTAMQTPGLSTQEAMGMQQSLAELGRFPGEWQTNEIMDAQTKLFSRGGVLQELATNPDVLQMMDKGMRTGSSSIKEITEMVEEIPTAAKTAHVGMGQMIADMKSYGELAESQGGTIFGGAQQALQLAAATGQPASASMGMIDNPWAQSMIYRQTGTPSYMQGPLPAAVKNQYANMALQQARQLVGHYAPKHIRNPISDTSETVTSISQEAAAIKALVPGYEKMSTEQIERHLRGGNDLATGERARMQTLGALETWKKDATGMFGQGRNVDNFISGGNSGQMQGGFGHILSEMRNEMTPDGRHRYSHDDIRKIREAGVGLHGEDLIKAKYHAVNDIIESKAGKQGENQEGEQVTIGLSPAAKRFLTVEGRRSRGKREANAGGSEPVNHSFTGATDPLPPNTNSPNEYGYPAKTVERSILRGG